MAAPCPFRLAHLSDLHIGPLPRVAPRQLLSKRLLGYLSWRTRKQRIHRMEVLAALRHDLQASAPDHVVITGDLVNLGLPAEFAQAGAWLRNLGTPEWISVVPGNHDAYVRVGAGKSWEPWADYMRSDESPSGWRRVSLSPTSRPACDHWPLERDRNTAWLRDRSARRTAARRARPHAWGSRQ